MKRQFILVTIIMVSSNIWAHAQLDTSLLTKNIHAAEDSMVAISKRKDWNAYADYMHPAVIELAGGRDGLITLLENQSALLDGTEVQEYYVGKIFQLSKFGTQYQCIVETFLQMKIRDNVISATSYDIAASNDGNTWTFFRIAPTFTSDQLRKIIPGLNPDFKFPLSKTEVGKTLDEFRKTYVLEYLE